MALSPNDIRTCEFSTQMRGYQKEEVDDFLEQIAATMETDKQANLKVSMEIDSIKAQLASLREQEDTIKGAAIDARRNADQTVAEANAKAAEMLDRAQTESQRLLGSQEDQLRELENRVNSTREIQDSYLGKLRELIESHLDMLTQMEEAHRQDKTTQDAIEITDSSEVSRNGMETLATPPKMETVHTEEAGAAETILTAGDQPDDEAIDPELTAALESYQSSVNQSADAAHTDGTPPPPSDQVQTDSITSGGVPEGFVIEGEADDDESTGKMDMPRARAAITDIPEPSPDDSQPVSSSELAEELDKVVAKFEEEMDKAAKAE